jgi:hypothetical protein
MKPISELNFEDVNLIVFDVDGVIVPRGSEITENGNLITMDLKFPSSKFIDLTIELLEFSNVAISSGRSMLTLKTMFSELLGEERNGNHFILQAENGGRISWGADELSAGHDPIKLKNLAKIRSEIRKIEHENLIGFEPKESILTVHCKDRVEHVETILENHPHSIVWSGEAYDIGDPLINKGTGLERIKKELENRTGKKINAIAIGDRNNDKELLEKADISVSADPEILKSCDYFVSGGEDLPGVIMAEKILEIYKN